MHTLHLSILLILGVSLCEVLELVASFPTSPNLSKTEIVCIFYCVFEFGGLSVFRLGRFNASLFLVILSYADS